MALVEFQNNTSPYLSAENLNGNFDYLDDKIDDLKDGEWHDLSLTSAWDKYNDTFYTPSYCKRGNFVYLRGLLKRSSNLVGEEIIAVLPEGYRPSKRMIINVLTGGNLSQRIDLYADGNIKTASNVASSDILSFDNIGFYID